MLLNDGRVLPKNRVVVGLFILPNAASSYLLNPFDLFVRTESGYGRSSRCH